MPPNVVISIFFNTGICFFFSGVGIYNLGTGRGTSVLELFHAFEKACGKKMKYVMAERRAGDIASCYADSSLAEKVLDWKATLSIEQACIDTWNWQSKNPNGFRSGAEI